MEESVCRVQRSRALPSTDKRRHALEQRGAHACLRDTTHMHVPTVYTTNTQRMEENARFRITISAVRRGCACGGVIVSGNEEARDKYKRVSVQRDEPRCGRHMINRPRLQRQRRDTTQHVGASWHIGCTVMRTGERRSANVAWRGNDGGGSGNGGRNARRPHRTARIGARERCEAGEKLVKLNRSNKLYNRDSKTNTSVERKWKVRREMVKKTTTTPCATSQDNHLRHEGDAS